MSILQIDYFQVILPTRYLVIKPKVSSFKPRMVAEPLAINLSQRNVRFQSKLTTSVSLNIRKILTIQIPDNCVIIQLASLTIEANYVAEKI